MHDNSANYTPLSLRDKSSISRRDFISTSLKVGAAAFTTSLLPNLNIGATGQYNVLFIMVDDLRPLLGCYGHSEMHTPNIDRLASRGTVFNRAYCQYPVCNPSRASILTGLRPETNGVEDNHIHFRDTIPDVVSLPQYFKEQGYHTRSIGKIMHGPFDDVISWSEPSWEVKGGKYTDLPSWQSLDVSDEDLEDGKIANQTIKVLKDLQSSLFFLALGFNKPHMPFNAPTKYYELYTPDTNFVPQVVPHAKHELRGYTDIPSGEDPISKEKTIELIHGYKASTSYMDAQVGRVLNQLDTLGLTERTIILLCSDHGFHLGEHELWGKRTLFEVALRAPLIVSLPEQKTRDVKTDALVELVDIYPTLCDASNLSIPEELEGISMVPVIQEPTLSWKSATFSKVGKAYGKRSIRTERYRYTEHALGKYYGNELYDYNSESNASVNLAHLPENVELVAQLSEQIKEGWQAALPHIQSTFSPSTTQTWDVNNDGVVDIQDLLLVANSFESDTLEDPKVDVNKDGTVDIIDLLLVASHLGESSETAAPKSISLPFRHVDRIEQLVSEARLVNDGSNLFRIGIANLEMLIDSAIPIETMLLPNYPNPFNPETWIPYDLAEATDVHITIYNSKGESVRQLEVGFQVAGTHRDQSRAAYWDGCNTVGEPVASGIYFYTLQAGQVRASRKMVLRK